MTIGSVSGSPVWGFGDGELLVAVGGDGDIRLCGGGCDGHGIARSDCSRSVGPPSSQWVTWWASQSAGGRWQSGWRQPLSRRLSATRWAGEMLRVVRPTSSGIPVEPSRTGMILLSQAMRRRSATGSVPPPGRCPTPIPARRSVSVMVTIRWGLLAPGGVAGAEVERLPAHFGQAQGLPVREGRSGLHQPVAVRETAPRPG